MSDSALAAVEKARETAREWAKRTPNERGAALLRLRDLLAKQSDSIARTVSEEIGKPLQEAYGAEVLSSLRALNWLVRAAPKALAERKIPGSRGAFQQAVPVGVVGVIGTWNYPIYLNLTAIAWALAAGNAVVWKPSELANDSACALASLFEAAGLPVFTVTGGAETGRELCNAGCDKIAFTGGTATGRAILSELAKTETPAVMELSGHDAMLVCADADAALAARSAVWGRISNAGQSCVAPCRIYVVSAVYETFLAECRREMEGLKPGTDYGPLRTESLRHRSHAMVKDAIGRGARLLIGGYCLPDEEGFYYAPALLADCRAGMVLMEQDFFGPVLAVCPVADEAEGVAQANRSEMGLGATIWTRDVRKALQIARDINAGTISINDVLLDAAEPNLPFGGLGESGFGKQRGIAGLEEFIIWKTITPHKSGGSRRHLFPYRPATLPILRGLIALQTAQGVKAKLNAARELTRAAMNWKK